MIVLIIIASAFLQAATSAHFNATVYAVTVSSQVRGGSLETLCAQIHAPTEPVTLTLTLSTESAGNTTILVQEAITQDYYRCLHFQVPAVSSSEVATIHVAVEGANDVMRKATKVLIQPAAFINLVQTDKPIYKPGQTVQFRIVSLDAGFLPINRKYKTVELQDPTGNRIAQWLDKTASSGLLDLSHPMSPEAAQGTYLITAWTDEDRIQISHSFDIKEYVLPKYEVKVHLPSVISILDEEVTMKICGKYTYGKPVIGVVMAVLCRKAFRYYWHYNKQSDICRTYDLTADKSGCATQVVNVTEFSPSNRAFDDKFVVDAEMEESATGVILKGKGSASFTSDIRTVTFEDVPAAYKPGIKFEGKVKVTGPDSTPAINEPVYVFAHCRGPTENLTLTTDNKGMASFSLDTSLWKDRVSLQARSTSEEQDSSYDGSRKPRYRSAHMSLTEFYSKSNSFVKLVQASEPFLCSEAVSVHAEYIIQGKELKRGQTELNFFYLVTSRGGIVQQGQVPVTVAAGVNKGTFSLQLKQTADMTPYAQVVVYTILPTGEAVADSKDFPIELCLKNKVSLKYSSLQALPGEKTSLNLKAQPGSLCSVRAIDQSILLLQPENELNLKYVYNLLPVQKLTGYDYQVNDHEPYLCLPSILVPEPPMLEPEPPILEPEPPILEPEPPILAAQPSVLEAFVLGLDVPTLDDAPPEPVDLTKGGRGGRTKRSYYFGPTNEKNDVYGIFKEIGIKLVTNSDVKKPYNCDINFYTDYVDAPVPMAFNTMQVETASDTGTSRLHGESKETVRTHFPETWIWDLVAVGDDGALSLEQTVPDTITKWAAGAFCTSSSAGLGLAPDTALTAFKPFFVSLTLPYSVIRGEVFTLKATVFNYLSKCIMVQATLSQSDDYTVRQCDGCVYTLCLCGEESHTFNWIVTPTTLGKVSLKVSAEALRTEQLCGNDIATVPEKGQKDTVIRPLLVEAEGAPETSTHNAFLCPAEGKPVEEVISLQLPEKFIAGSPKAFVSVLGDLMGRAMKNLDKLLAMPYGCGEQNMVLFAPNIYILRYLQSTGQLTTDIQDRATRFLESGYQRQLNYKHDEGSYSAFGKSDKSGNTWLTAFVMKSFAGAKPFIFVDPNHVRDAKSWLASHQRKDGCINSVGKLLNNGMKGGVSDDISLTAYITAALLEVDPDTTDPVVEKCLDCLKQAVAGKLDNRYTTALLAYTFTLAGNQDIRLKLITSLHQQAITGDGSRHWERSDGPSKRLDSLAVEMTSYTLLALLSGNATIPDFGLDYAAGIVRWLAQQQNPWGGFASTQDTVVALQALALFGAATYSPGGNSIVTVSTTSGPVTEFRVDESNRLLYQEKELAQVPWNYTIRAQGESCVLTQIAMHYNIPPPPDFSSFNISTCVVANCNASRPQLTVTVGVRYQGRREETNMVIINMKLLSGYIAEKSSITLLKKRRLVKRVEVEEGHINIYLDGMKKDFKTFEVILQEDVPVRNLRPAVVKIYDYYQTSDEAVTDYTSSCAESDTVNEL